jgi:hypothetical protein
MYGPSPTSADISRDEEAFPDLLFASPFMIWARDQRINHDRHVCLNDYIAAHVEVVAA